MKRDCMTCLNLLRESHFHLRLIEQINSQFEAWKNGEIGDTNMVDYGDINRELLYSVLYSDPNAESKSDVSFIFMKLNKEILQDMKKALGVFAEGEEQYVPSRIYPVIMDKQLMATFLGNEEVKEHEIKIYDQLSEIENSVSSCLTQDLQENAAYKRYMEMASEHEDICGSKTLRILAHWVNVLLLTTGCGIYAFRSMEGFPWPCLATLGVFILSSYVAYKSMCTMNERYDEKLFRLERFIHNTMNKEAGEQPDKNPLARLKSNLFTMILLAIVGAVIGSFFMPPIGTIVGLLVGAAFGNSSTEEVESDGSEYKEIKTGNGWFSYLLLLGLIAAIIYLFI